MEESNEDDNNDCYWEWPQVIIEIPLDPCEFTTEINCGDAVYGSTYNEANKWTADNYGNCYEGSDSYAGKDKFYILEVPEESDLKIELTNLTDNLDLFVLNGCGFGATCLAASTNDGTYSERITIDNAQGTYYIVVDGRSADDQGEFKISVNCGEARPNLTCKEKGYLHVDGSYITISNIWLANNGSGYAPASKLGYYLSRDNYISTDDVLIGSDYIGSLAPGATAGVSFSTDLKDHNLPPGTYFLGLFIDHKYEVAESNEYDNNDCYWTYPEIVVEAPQGPCEYASHISCGQTIQGHTLDETNDFTGYDYDCYYGNYDYKGNDKVYKIHVPYYSTLKIDLTYLTDNLDLFLLNSCGDYVECLGKSTNGGKQEEHITLYNAQGTYYIVVDAHYYGLTAGYLLTANCHPVSLATCECYDYPYYSVCEDFDDRTYGPISSQVDCWSTWSGIEEGNEDPHVRGTSSDKYLKMEGVGYDWDPQENVVLKLGNRTNGKYELKFKMYVKGAKKAYFSILHEFNAGGTDDDELAQEVVFFENNFAHLRVNNKYYDFYYNHDEWIDVYQQIDLGSGWTTLYIDGVLIGDWDFAQQHDSPNGTNKLSGLNFRTFGNKYLYHVDDITLKKVTSFSEPQWLGIPDVGTPQELRGRTLPASKKISPVLDFEHFPNPTTGHITVSGELNERDNVKIELLNTVGHVIRTFKQSDAQSFTHRFDLAGQSPGVYLIRVQTAKEVVTKPIVLTN